MQDLLESMIAEVLNVDILYIVGKYHIAYQNSCDAFAVSVRTFDENCVVRMETSVHNEFAYETIKLLRERVEHLCSFLHRNCTVRDLPPSVDTWGILRLKSMTEYNRLCTLTWDKATEVLMNDAMFERCYRSLLKCQQNDITRRNLQQSSTTDVCLLENTTEADSDMAECYASLLKSASGSEQDDDSLCQKQEERLKKRKNKSMTVCADDVDIKPPTAPPKRKKQSTKESKKKQKRPSTAFSAHASGVLNIWFEENIINPYPDATEKQDIATRAGLSSTQVSNWFINARVRKWRPVMRDMPVTKAKRWQSHDDDDSL